MILRTCSALSFVFLSKNILTICPFSVSKVSPSFRNFSSASFSVKWLPKVAMTTARLFFFPPSRTTVFLNPSARPYAIPCLTRGDRKSTRLNSSHLVISYAVFCLKKKIHHVLHDSKHAVQPVEREV